MLNVERFVARHRPPDSQFQRLRDAPFQILWISSGWKFCQKEIVTLPNKCKKICRLIGAPAPSQGNEFWRNQKAHHASPPAFIIGLVCQLKKSAATSSASCNPMLRVQCRQASGLTMNMGGALSRL